MKALRPILGVCVGLFISLQVNAQENLVPVMDRLLSACWTGDSINETSSEVASAQRWFNSLNKSEQGELLSVLLDRVEKTSEQNENAGFIKAAEEYLLFSPADDDLRGDILEMLGKIYTDHRDLRGLSFTRNRLASYAALTGRDFETTISALSRASAEFAPLSKSLEGYWVSDKVNKNGFPEYVYYVQDKSIFIQPCSSGEWKNSSMRIGEAFKENYAAQLFEVNDNTNEIRFDFYSQTVKGGSQFLSGTMYDFAQATGRANAEYSAQQGVTLGSALGAAVEASIIAGIFEGIGDAVAKARSSVFWLSNYGQRIKPGLLDVSAEQKVIKKTLGSDKEREYVTPEKIHLYHIDPSDHIVFQKDRKQGILSNCAVAEDAIELERINKKNKTIAAVCGTMAAVGTSCIIVGGIMGLTLKDKESPNMTTPQLVGLSIMCGGLLMDIITIPIWGSEEKKYKQFNLRQMQKLKDKYGVSVTAVPVYDPFTNTAGGAIAMTF